MTRSFNQSMANGRMIGLAIAGILAVAGWLGITHHSSPKPAAPAIHVGYPTQFQRDTCPGTVYYSSTLNEWYCS